jgi:hypothetical protein
VTDHAQRLILQVVNVLALAHVHHHANAKKELTVVVANGSGQSPRQVRIIPH